jgi:hypothetical protein
VDDGAERGTGAKVTLGRGQVDLLKENAGKRGNTLTD